MKAWLGLGANLQRPVMQLKEALRRLGAEDRIEVLRISSFYRTPPWGDEQQDEFINAVVQIETSLAPMPLLHVTKSIENVMGRQRSGRRWGPRLIDIDLLMYGDKKVLSDELELPHPRMHERAFVLLPMAELDASAEIPGHGVIENLLGQLDCSGICLLNENDVD
jgi:2-amino-4-hydroxy-6-hydroxymethyldihydropteridine diphosphokinase